MYKKRKRRKFKIIDEDHLDTKEENS